MRGSDFIAFDDFAQLPARHDVGDATVFFYTANDDFGHKLAVATDQKLAVLKNALILTNVQHNKIPFGIHHKNFAFEIGTQFDVGVRPFIFCKAGFQS